MRKTIVMFLILTGVSSPAFGEKKYTKAEREALKKEVCEPKSPQDKCRDAGGKWKDGMCVIVKKHTVRKRVVRKVRVQKTIPTPSVSLELKCYRLGGEWREKDGLCYEKSAPAPAIILPPVSKSVTVRQNQSVVLHNTTPAPTPNPVTPPVKTVKPKPQWWWMGVGVWSMGLFAGQYDFVPGLYGTLVFALNHRFRVAGNIGVGYGPWQENGKLDVWFGGYFAVRAYKELFINFGVETMWGGFDGLSVHRRMFAASSGPEYWFGNRASIGLRLFVGLHDNVTDCQIKSGTAVGGGLFTTAVYF